MKTLTKPYKTLGGTCSILLLLFLAGCNALLTPPATPAATPVPAGQTTARPTATLRPDVFLTPIPATPTFTPIPTPTPVMHIVEQGDTLFGIALEYGVNVDNLVQVNGIDPDDFLSIGQSLVIPLNLDEESEASGMVAPVGHMILPTPTPLSLSVASTAQYDTPAGGLWYMGEVVNTLDNPVTNLQVQVVLMSADGMPLLTHVTLAAADYLLPGMRAPFAVLIKEPPVGTADIQAALLRAEWISAITANFLPLDVLNAQGAVSGPQYRVSGQVQNNSGAAVQRFSVVVTLYDTEGRVVGYRQKLWAPNAAIGAGQSAPFDVLLTPQTLATPASFQVIAWGITS